MLPIKILIILCIIYILLTIYLVYLVHRIPRKPIKDIPDWGNVTDTKIPTPDNGFLEVWKVEPKGNSRGIVLLAHGWSRNRDRMVDRARVFGELGFTAVMHSARDHGNSSPKKLVNGFRFGEDIETVMDWINEPILLYGHSAGAAGAIIAATRNLDRVTHLFLEGCYDETRKALLSLYRSYNKVFGYLFAPVVIIWMDLFYRLLHKKDLNALSPARLAASIDIPVMLIHGEKDQSFPLGYALNLKQSFHLNSVEMFIAKGSGHSDSSLDPLYPEAVKGFLKRNYK